MARRAELRATPGGQLYSSTLAIDTALTIPAVFSLARERENLVGEKTRIVNRMKAALIRLGIRGFRSELRKAPRKLDDLRTPEGLPIPPNTLDEIRRDMTRLAMVREQIDLIEQVRLERIAQAPDTGPNAMVRLVSSSIRFDEVVRHTRRLRRGRELPGPRSATDIRHDDDEPCMQRGRRVDFRRSPTLLLFR